MMSWDDPHRRYVSRGVALVAGLLLLLPPLAGLMSDAANGVTPLASLFAVSAAAASLLWGTLRRDIMFLLPGFLVTAAATTSGLSEPVREALLSGTRASTWWTVAGLYVLLALRACDRSSSARVPVDQAGPPDALSNTRLRVHQLRSVAAIALLVMPLGAAIATQVDPFSTDLEAQATVIFAGLLPFFLWVILFYTFFIAPDVSRDLEPLRAKRRQFHWSVARTIALPVVGACVLLVFRGFL
jgi:hypothetical protein